MGPTLFPTVLSALLLLALATAAAACGADALGTSRTLVVGTRDGPRFGTASYPRTLPLDDHEVVPTFDDGPSAGTTPVVLDALAHECVKATFFLIGRHAEAQPALVKRALSDGHTLGHHSFSHPARTLRRMSFGAAQADIVRGFEVDDNVAYGEAAETPRVAFFRFPGFADTTALDAWLATRNIAIFGTDVWANDWFEESPTVELGVLMRQLDKERRGIILLHDIRPSTAKMMPSLLRTLKDGGYRIVHIVPGPGFSETAPAPDGWTSTTEPIIADAFRREAALRRARAAGGQARRSANRARRFMRHSTPPRLGRRNI